MKGDIACRENRDIDAALDDQIKPGHGADLRLDRPAQCVAVEKPGHCEQTDQDHAEPCQHDPRVVRFRRLERGHAVRDGLDAGQRGAARRERSQEQEESDALQNLTEAVFATGGFVSAFVLFELGESESLRQVARVSDAVNWFAHNLATLDPDTRRLWDRASAKCGSRRHRQPLRTR